MSKRIGRLESTFEKKIDTVEGKVKEQEDRTDEQTVLLEAQFEAIRGLTIQAQLLEGIALGVRHCHTMS